MSDSGNPPLQPQDDHPGVVDIPPPTNVVRAQALVTGGIFTTSLALVVIALGCLLWALKLLVYLGLVLLVVTIILLLQARKNLVVFARHPGVVDVPPPG